MSSSAAHTFALVLLRHFPVLQIQPPIFCWSVIFHSCKFQSPMKSTQQFVAVFSCNACRPFAFVTCRSTRHTPAGSCVAGGCRFVVRLSTRIIPATFIQLNSSRRLSYRCVAYIQWLTGPAVHCVQPVMSCPLNCKDSPQRKVSRDSRMCSNYIVRYYPSRRQSWGIGVSATFGCLFVRTIYQKPLQLGSPNLT